MEYERNKVFQTYFASELATHVIHTYGLIQVLDSTVQRVPRTYMKVFANEKTGEVSFYKDGYTGVRGKFDYVSLNTNQLERVEASALLVKHDTLGVVVVMARPPAK